MTSSEINESWVDLSEDTRAADFHGYTGSISEARFVMRKVTRILDESARANGVDPLQHQALLQVYGTAASTIAIHELASRLDVVPAFASRLVKQLEEKGLATRSVLEGDKRVALIKATEAGIELLRAVDREVHHHMAYFQHSLYAAKRRAALAIFAFYVGEPSTSEIARAIQGPLE